MHLHPLLATLVLTLAISPAVAQRSGLASSRVIYKCQVGGKVVYTDEPCLGAERVDIQPTRGLNKSSGRELTGADVRRERSREQVAEAVRPITGMNPAQYETARTRIHLSAATKSECATLDNSLAKGEAAERISHPGERPALQASLFVSRQRFRELRC